MDIPMESSEDEVFRRLGRPNVLTDDGGELCYVYPVSGTGRRTDDWMSPVEAEEWYLCFEWKTDMYRLVWREYVGYGELTNH